MKKIRKICVVITARPSYSRIKTALKAIKKHPALELQLVVAASALLDRYGTAVKHIEEDGFKISARVFMVLEGGSPTAMAKTTGLGTIELSNVFDNLEPDVVLTVADRYETLATAIAAAYMNIPVVHIQGGEISGSLDEKVRHAVTKLADIHFVSTQKARERVIQMGEDPGKVFVTGCPSLDIAAEVLRDPDLDFDPFKKYGGVGDLSDISKGYLVVIQHPVTTEYKKSREHVLETLYAVSAQKLPVLWFWPNADAGSDGTSNGIRAFRENERLLAKKLHFFKNMAPRDFLKLVYNSRCLVGNSSLGVRECSYLGVPVVNIGSRQLGRERGPNVLDVGYKRGSILEAIRRHSSGKRYNSLSIYGDGKAGKKIAELLAKIPLDIEKRFIDL